MVDIFQNDNVLEYSKCADKNSKNVYKPYIGTWIIRYFD